jgi:hypothetical protein
MTLLEIGTPKYALFVVILQQQSVLFAENVRCVRGRAVENLNMLFICWVKSVSIEQNAFEGIARTLRR